MYTILSKNGRIQEDDLTVAINKAKELAKQTQGYVTVSEVRYGSEWIIVAFDGKYDQI